MGRPNRKSNNVHGLLWFMLLVAISDCEARTLPGSAHSSLRMSSQSHTAAESRVLQFGNHSISQYACQGALRPTFIIGWPSCFVFGCGLVLLLRELEKLEKAHNQRFISKGCTAVLEWFVLCLGLFFFIFLGFTIACVKIHRDTGIDQTFYIVAFVAVLLLLISLWNEYLKAGEWDTNNGRERLAQAGVSIFVVCTGLFVLVMVLRPDNVMVLQLDQLYLFLYLAVGFGACIWLLGGLMVEVYHVVRREQLAQAGVAVFVVTGLFVLFTVLRSNHGIRLDHHTTAPIAYWFYTVFFSGVWCIGWALWMRHCKHNAEASIKPEECGINIPGNAKGLAQVLSLVINTYSFAGFSFAPSIPWTTAPSSISPVPILWYPVIQWYSNYVSAA
jgi:hypothetical protein